MKKVTITSLIKNGKVVNRKIIAIAQSFEGKKVDITFQRAKKKRSNEQNRYYWGVIVPMFQQGIFDCFGEIWDIKTTHQHLKSTFNRVEKVNEKTGEVVQLLKSTSENSTIEMEEYHENIRAWMRENMDIICPLPNENLTLKF